MHLGARLDMAAKQIDRGSEGHSPANQEGGPPNAVSWGARSPCQLTGKVCGLAGEEVVGKECARDSHTGRRRAARFRSSVCLQGAYPAYAPPTFSHRAPVPEKARRS